MVSYNKLESPETQTPFTVNYVLGEVSTCCAQSLGRIRLLATPWTVACKTPLFMGFFRLEYWSGLPFPSPEVSITMRIIKASQLGPVIYKNYAKSEEAN